MESIFTILGLATSSLIDKASDKLAKNFHHINNNNNDMINGVVDTISESLDTLLRFYTYHSNGELDLEINELRNIVGTDDEFSFKDIINGICLTYADRPWRTENNDDYYLVTVMRSYVNFLKTIADIPINNADEYILVNENSTLHSINLPFDFNWYLKPVKQKFFKVKYRDDFTFIFSNAEDFTFLHDICLMLSVWKSFGEMSDNYHSCRFNKYTDMFSETLGICDEYDVSISRFIDFLKAESDFNTFMNDHRFTRL